MKHLSLFLIMLFLSFGSTFAQDPNEDLLWVTFKNDNLEPLNADNKNLKSKNDRLNKIFEENNVFKYSQALPFAKSPELLKIYQINCKGKASKIKESLEKEFGNEVKWVRQFGKPIATYDPTDYMWSLTTQDTTGWLWHLHKIRANLAWDITHGSSNIKIAIIDSWFDVNHPDLDQKITPHYDPYPYDHTNFTSDCTEDNHGTTVASFAAAETNGGGQLASVGFDTELICFNSNNAFAKALYASNVLNVDIINFSWYSWCDPDTTGSEELIMKEILDNGTIIVAAAGNGTIDCNGGELFPFSAYYDERIIIVTSTDVNDNHTFIENGINKTHSHYANVDICAPGYNVMGAKCTKTLDSGNCVDNPWPYSGASRGTSFATPIVAGVCALMRSINPCMTPAQAQTFIKATADPVTDAASYPGLIGAGRINAYKAVKMAGTRNYSSTTLSGTKNLSAGYGFNLTNVTIGNSSNVNLTARKEVNIDGAFSVPVGSTFSINISPTAQTNCQ